MKFNIDKLRTEMPSQPDLPPEEMIDRTFLMPPQDDGTRVRAKILQQVQDMKDGAHREPEMVKFKCLVDDKYEEVVAYNDIVDYIEQDSTWDGIWKFKAILDHHGPVKAPKKDKTARKTTEVSTTPQVIHKDTYMGSRYNVLVL